MSTPKRDLLKDELRRALRPGKDRHLSRDRSAIVIGRIRRRCAEVFIDFNKLLIEVCQELRKETRVE